MGFATPKFDQAVADLKALCGTHTQLFRYGQFYVTRRTIDDLFGQIVSDLSGNIRFVIAPEQLESAKAFFKARLSADATKIDVVSIMNMLNLIEVKGDMAAIRAMFAPPTELDKAHARADLSAVWSNTSISTAPAYSGSAASLGKAQAASELEKGACSRVLHSFATKLLEKRGGVRLLPTVVTSEAVVAGASVKQTAPGAPPSPGVAEVIARETLDYAQPALLTVAATRMRAAIDAGGFIECGVLSGARHEHSVFPKPEHYIMVFAYDTLDGQDAFLFWDPDAARSSIASTSWGNGFGVLFSRAGRLCTGVDDADLADIERTKDVGTEGDHLRDTRRHSYQVYSLQTLPMAARLKVHVKVLRSPTRATVDAMLDRAVGFFAMNGLEVLELSRETIETPDTGFDRYQRLYVGGDPDGDVTADVADLHATLRAPRDFAVTPLATEVVIAFVDSMVPAQRGCSIHPLEQPGIVISSALANEWTLAHEIGRLLGLLSSAAPGELTYQSTDGLGDDVPLLSEDNLESLLVNPLVEA